MNRYLTKKLVSPVLRTAISPSNLCLSLYEQLSHTATCVSRSMNSYLTQQLVSPALWTGIPPNNLCLPLYEQVSHPANFVSRSMNRYLTQQLVPIEEVPEIDGHPLHIIFDIVSDGYSVLLAVR